MNTGPLNSSYAAARQAMAFRTRHEQGVLEVTGADRLPWLNGLLTNDVLALAPGADRYAAWLTPQGRMVTDMFVVANDDSTWLDVPAPLAPALAGRLDGMIFAEDARVADVPALASLEIVGPDAAGGLDAVRRAVGSAGQFRVRPVERPVPGFVVYVPRAGHDAAVAALRMAGAVELDEGTAEVLRVEAGIPRFLVDMNEETIPLEAGLDRAISHTKGCYVGQEIIVRIRDRAHGRVARHLVGLLLEGPDVPATDQPVLADGRPVGRLTSAVRSVALGQTIALATLHRDHASAGRPVTLSDGTVGTVAELPFVP